MIRSLITRALFAVAFLPLNLGLVNYNYSKINDYVDHSIAPISVTSQTVKISWHAPSHISLHPITNRITSLALRTSSRLVSVFSVSSSLKNIAVSSIIKKEIIGYNYSKANEYIGHSLALITPKPKIADKISYTPVTVSFSSVPAQLANLISSQFTTLFSGSQNPPPKKIVSIATVPAQPKSDSTFTVIKSVPPSAASLKPAPPTTIINNFNQVINNAKLSTDQLAQIKLELTSADTPSLSVLNDKLISLSNTVANLQALTGRSWQAPAVTNQNIDYPNQVTFSKGTFTGPISAQNVSVAGNLDISGTTTAANVNISGLTTLSSGLIGTTASFSTNFEVVGYASLSNALYTKSGLVGVGTTSPARKLDVLNATSVAQLRISQSGSVYAEFYVDSAGDIQTLTTGGNVRINNENVWVCSGGSCGATAPSGTGNIVIENAVIFDNNVKIKRISSTVVDVLDSTGSTSLEFDNSQ